MQEEILMDNLGYDSEYIERSGFVFVCDCKNKSNLDTVIKIIEKMLEIERYTYKMNLNEDDTSQVTLVNVLIEDTFALNNSLLNKPPEMIHSPILLQQRKKMTRAFKDIMFTSAEKRNKLQAAENQANANKKKVKKI